jgi:ankyrin repeat protein
MTPLHLAAVKGNVDLLNILLDAGADLSLKNEWNRTAVHRAFFYGHQEAANFLIDRAGPDFDTRDIEEIARLESVDPEVAKRFKYLD